MGGKNDIGRTTSSAADVTHSILDGVNFRYGCYEVLVARAVPPPGGVQICRKMPLLVFGELLPDTSTCETN